MVLIWGSSTGLAHMQADTRIVIPRKAAGTVSGADYSVWERPFDPRKIRNADIYYG